MNTGISIYFGSGMKKNREVIEKAKNADISYVFTSLHIPEETEINYRDEMKQLIGICRNNGWNLIADVGPETMEKLGCQFIEELEDIGINYIRPDYGFDAKQIAEFSHLFHIVVNASTVSEGDIRQWRAAGADFERFAACHNFYPKPLTALSIDKVKRVNNRFKMLGFQTMAFVAGDKTMRGPLFEGLPTVEGHRNGDVLYNMLQLFNETESDVVIIGDVDCSDDTWKKIGRLNKNYVELRADIRQRYEFICDIVHHDRPDSSEYVIRSQESRKYQGQIAETIQQRPAGSIFIGNEGFMRYQGELEIARTDLLPEARVNVIGQVVKEDIKYIPYIKDGMGFQLKIV